MPNQYHHFYDQGDTLIYPEHIADLLTIDKMYNIRIEKEHQKKEAKKGVKDLNNNKSSNKGSGPSNFYGQKFMYRNNNKK